MSPNLIKSPIELAVIVDMINRGASTLIALDTDGIFHTEEDSSEYVSGLMDVNKFVKWVEQQKMCKAITVSESPFYPKNPDGSSMFPICQGKSRAENLEDAKKLTNNPSIKLYVSDNGDIKEAEKADFFYVDVRLFAQLLNLKWSEK
jgi:hypothetical protein